MMKIVVLDGHTLTQGDLTWDALRALGEVTIYDRTEPALVVPRLADAAIALTNKTIITAEHIAALPHLRYIGVLATGYNVVDLQTARSAGIVITNIPAYSTASVAQMVFAHLLNITQQVEHYAQENRRGRWSGSVDFSYADTRLIELKDKTFGIVGLGNTGMATAKIALAFGMKVIALTSKRELPSGISSVSLDELLANSDVVSLHCPLCADTHHIINKNALAKMKSSAILINCGRGPLVDEEALAAALRSGRISAACLDVLSTEPPRADNPLLSLPNCYITPHIAWATAEARKRLMDIAIQNIRDFLDGHPQNVVS